MNILYRNKFLSFQSSQNFYSKKTFRHLFSYVDNALLLGSGLHRTSTSSPSSSSDVPEISENWRPRTSSSPSQTSSWTSSSSDVPILGLVRDVLGRSEKTNCCQITEPSLWGGSSLKLTVLGQSGRSMGVKLDGHISNWSLFDHPLRSDSVLEYPNCSPPVTSLWFPARSIEEIYCNWTNIKILKILLDHRIEKGWKGIWKSFTKEIILILIFWFLNSH